MRIESRKRGRKHRGQRGNGARTAPQATVSNGQEHKVKGVCSIWLNPLRFHGRFRIFAWELWAKPSSIDLISNTESFKVFSRCLFDEVMP